MQPESINILRCWLFDQLYRQLPRDQDPDFDVLCAQLHGLERIDRIKSFGDGPIVSQILNDIRTGDWKKPPVPTNKTARKLFPHWNEWHLTQSQPQPGPATVSVPAASIPQITSPATTVPATSNAPAFIKKRPKWFRDTGYAERLVTADEKAAVESESWGDYLETSLSQISLDNDGEGEKTKIVTSIQNSRSLFRTTNGKERADAGQVAFDDIMSMAPLFTSDVVDVDVSLPQQCSIFGRLLDPQPVTVSGASTGWGAKSGQSTGWGDETRHNSGWGNENRPDSGREDGTNSGGGWGDGTAPSAGRVEATDQWGDKADQGTGWGGETRPNVGWGEKTDTAAAWEDKTDRNAAWVDNSPSDEGVDREIVLLNTNTPWTAFICGLQGAGKSHSLAIILENCLIPHESLGALLRPLSALVFYYSPYSPVGISKPCEAAFLSTPRLHTAAGISSVRKVTVLVSRSNMGNMVTAYSKIPNVSVRQLLLKPSQLTINTMLQLMAVQQDNNALYMQVVTRILRDMAADGGGYNNFNYEKFKEMLQLEPLTPSQWKPLKMRLELLESFIGSEKNPDLFNPEPGTVTIVDLTCPFVDAETACVLFSICNDLFCSAPCSTGKIVALDEAHKFMSNQTSSQLFANSIIQNIRLQRHLGLRTIISTQDPQVHPELLELSSFVIMHRFDSPRWFTTLKQHVGFDDGTRAFESADDGGWGRYGSRAPRGAASSGAFEEIMRLDTGEAYIYCPQLVTSESTLGGGRLKKSGNRLLKIRVRQKVTVDGGASKNVL